MKMNDGFYGLPPEERSYWYDKAKEETGLDFHDLSPEERARYYERARGGDDETVDE